MAKRGRPRKYQYYQVIIGEYTDYYTISREAAYERMLIPENFQRMEEYMPVHNRIVSIAEEELQYIYGTDLRGQELVDFCNNGLALLTIYLWNDSLDLEPAEVRLRLEDYRRRNKIPLQRDLEKMEIKIKERKRW